MSVHRISRAPLLAVVLLLVSGMASASPAPARPAAESPGSLYFLLEKGGAVAGEFSHIGSLVLFSSRAEKASKVTLRVEANGIAIDAAVDTALRTVSLNGHGKALFQDERQALQALSRALEERWQPRSNKLEPGRDLLYRLVLALSEAPAGFTFETLSFKIPEKTQTARRSRSRQFPDLSFLEENASSLSTAPRRFTTSQTKEVTDVGAPSCEVDDNNGVIYYPCGPFPDTVHHDASPSHCFGYLWEWVGCDFPNSCLGRCGAGCGYDGSGTYSWDCADHDSCCRVHGGCVNPSDAFCGDEYVDAIEDFFAGASCWGCLYPDPFSCQGYCYLQAPSGCWCDPDCWYYGDCCYDFQLRC